MHRRVGLAALAAIVAGVQLLPALFVSPPRPPSPASTKPADD